MDDLRHVLPLLIPIVAIVMGLGIAMLALWLDFEKKNKLLDIAHLERMRALELGRELPPLPLDVVGGDGRGGGPRTPASLLRRGLAWLLVGAALGVALWLDQGQGKAVYALIPCAFGLANLIAYALDGRRTLPQAPSRPL